MNEIEDSAWNSFVKVVQNFLGNNKADNYEELVTSMLNNLRKLGANMSIKVHYLHSHLDRFPEFLGDLSEEQGERFHQDVKAMEERYQGRWDNHMMVDYCWSLQCDCFDITHSRQSRKRRFQPSMFFTLLFEHAYFEGEKRKMKNEKTAIFKSWKTWSDGQKLTSFLDSVYWNYPKSPITFLTAKYVLTTESEINLNMLWTGWTMLDQKVQYHFGIWKIFHLE